MKSWKQILPIAGTLLMLTGVMAPSVFADYSEAAVETYSTKQNLEQVNLAVHTSYETEYYDTILHLRSEDKGIAVASADTEGHVLITAVGAGSTTISFWYKYSFYDASDDWTLVTVPVVVSGQAANTAQTSSAGSGLVFPKLNITLKSGDTEILSGLQRDGKQVNASDLVWLTTDQQVISVDQSTGQLTALNPGIASLYAVTKDGGDSGSVTVTVTE